MTSDQLRKRIEGLPEGGWSTGSSAIRLTKADGESLLALIESLEEKVLVLSYELTGLTGMKTALSGMKIASTPEEWPMSTIEEWEEMWEAVWDVHRLERCTDPDPGDCNCNDRTPS